MIKSIAFIAESEFMVREYARLAKLPIDTVLPAYTNKKINNKQSKKNNKVKK